MIQPAIGRVVWYRDAFSNPEAQPQAAIVTYVWSDTCVNLAVFNPNGTVYPVTSAFLFQGDGERPASQFAEWMPYQIGQAKKHAE
jgi:hypothetical protein